MKKLLLVDDDPNIRLVARMSLEEDWEVVEASGGKEALELAQTEKPDIILLDMMMPEMDGITVLRELREQKQFAYMPIIFLTAKVQIDEVQRYLALGASSVIVKPFDPMTLPDQVKEVVEKHKQLNWTSNP
jgi:two-component system, OmpR family, response regulator